MTTRFKRKRNHFSWTRKTTKIITGITLCRMLTTGNFYTCACKDTVKALLANEDYKVRIFECKLGDHQHSEHESIYLLRLKD